MLADWIHHNQMCRVIQHMQKVEILSKLHTHTITPCWLWLSKQRTSFISVFPSSPPSSLPLCVFRPPSHGHVWTTAVFGICFLTANHREWVSVFVHSQSINHVGPRWQWDQWLTGSSWDGRRCHRKTRKFSVRVWKASVSSFHLSRRLSILSFAWFASGCSQILSNFNHFSDKHYVWSKPGD